MNIPYGASGSTMHRTVSLGSNCSAVGFSPFLSYTSFRRFRHNENTRAHQHSSCSYCTTTPPMTHWTHGNILRDVTRMKRFHAESRDRDLHAHAALLHNGSAHVAGARRAAPIVSEFEAAPLPRRWGTRRRARLGRAVRRWNAGAGDGGTVLAVRPLLRRP